MPTPGQHLVIDWGQVGNLSWGWSRLRGVAANVAWQLHVPPAGVSPTIAQHAGPAILAVLEATCEEIGATDTNNIVMSQLAYAAWSGAGPGHLRRAAEGKAPGSPPAGGGGGLLLRAFQAGVALLVRGAQFVGWYPSAHPFAVGRDGSWWIFPVSRALPIWDGSRPPFHLDLDHAVKLDRGLLWRRSDHEAANHPL